MLVTMLKVTLLAAFVGAVVGQYGYGGYGGYGGGYGHHGGGYKHKTYGECVT